ncbi:dipeptide epimerase [Roseofilum casamattae]|uniref:Dipeptide epimerase n=1 Tax=Roseofilum casamattae BLCC-M143 TaxID=3022442 RepID=A0ABT7C1Z7_9CYAN|nr:dipeptide epimerase [Roseofilum casamattae]MDJ1185092.1 dipeptide epimerase [Roseofilum casamattae BLCC-M143]
MQIQINPFTVRKRFALKISRGSKTHNTNIWVSVEHDGITGWGEATPFSTGTSVQTTGEIVAALKVIVPILELFSPLERQQMQTTLAKSGISLPSAARAALDMACYDWLGKSVNCPLWQLWGLDRQHIPATSVTIGISSPEAARERLRHWQEMLPVRYLKVKLGSLEGIEADRAMLDALLEVVPEGCKVYVDANGGWNVKQAIAMAGTLKEWGIEYIEQPLAPGREQDLIQLYEKSPLPIFVDESCHTRTDIPLLADRIHGINIKLMKAGGLSEAMAMIHTARACGLQVMLGCYSDSSLSNTAASHLGALVDYLDLDSHLNLIDDPFTGATLQDSCLIPNSHPGLGVTRNDS